MENVPELLRSAEYEAFKKAAEHRARLPRRGPDPQRRRLRRPAARRRAIVIGVRDGEIPWPRQTHGDPGRPRRSAASPWRTFRDAVRGCRASRPARTGTTAATRDPRRSSATGTSRTTAATASRCRTASTPQGSATSSRACWRNKPTGTTDVFGRLCWERPAFTIRTEFYKPEKGRYLHPSEDRPITIREAARCMSFPDDFVLPGRSEVDGGRQADRQRRPAAARQAIAGAARRGS